MLYFPQLDSGCISQYPVVKRYSFRTIYNESLDGNRIYLGNAAPGVIEWELSYEGLSSAEAAALRNLFDAVEGQLGEFTFYDPVGNLLAWSEDVTRPGWSKGSLLQWTGGQADPWGGTQAGTLTNSGQAVQSLSQSIDIPGSYMTCLSFYAKSPAVVTMDVSHGTVEETVTDQVVVTPEWKRYQLGGPLGSTVALTVFTISVPAGVSVDIAGLQVEAQREASAYRTTFGQPGVYAKTRFAMDSLEFVAYGVDQYSATVRMTSLL